MKDALAKKLMEMKGKPGLESLLHGHEEDESKDEMAGNAPSLDSDLMDDEAKEVSLADEAGHDMEELKAMHGASGEMAGDDKHMQILAALADHHGGGGAGLASKVGDKARLAMAGMKKKKGL
jgi:hypothetical protein